LVIGIQNIQKRGAVATAWDFLFNAAASDPRLHLVGFFCETRAPLGTNPLVVSGSANFSEASTTDNDENMLIIRGNPRVADIYLGEFMRLYPHFAFRDWLTQHPGADEVEVGHLDENDQWWKRYFGDSFESRQCSYFAS
jgi:phosphatidylserine/phosphatidylglycerophosphate/cardiolipin synthase-like enzyme